MLFEIRLTDGAVTKQVDIRMTCSLQRYVPWISLEVHSESSIPLSFPWKIQDTQPSKDTASPAGA